MKTAEEPESWDKESVYDEQISPLMQQIIAICKEHDIPMFAEFQFQKGDFVTTHLPHGGHFVFEFFAALSQCKANENGINVDKFIMWLMKHPTKNTSSAYLHLLGKKAY